VRIHSPERVRVIKLKRDRTFTISLEKGPKTCCRGKSSVGAASAVLESKFRQEYLVGSRKHQGGGVDG
jgi:hypothetical protein